jgi:hypothetical protein
MRLAPDGLPAAVADGDRDAARLGGLEHRHADGEHAVVVAGLEVVGVQSLTEEDLAAEHALRPLADDQLLRRRAVEGPARGDARHVLLDRQLHRGGVHAGKVEVDVQVVALPIGVHRHRARRADLVEQRGGHAIELAERVEPASASTSPLGTVLLR